MANEDLTVTDPLGNKIFFSKTTCYTLTEGEENEVYDDMATVITKPALMIETGVSYKRKQLHYFRVVGWQNTLLILVEFNNHRWEATKCTKNPSNSELSELLRKGIQII